MDDEKQRLDQVFRGREDIAGKYRLDNPGNRFNFEILRAGITGRFHDLRFDRTEMKILDLGAGEMIWGDQLVAMGFDQDNYIGADLLLWRLQKGRQSGRAYQAVAASAAELPFPASTFDLISQFTMMTSVLDGMVKRQIAAEMMRVLKPGGFILWYDFRYSNPANPDARGIGRREMTSLFPDLPISLETTTLLPPLARKLQGPLSPLLKFLHRLPILRSHYLAVMGPKG